MIKTLTNLFKQDKEKFVVPKGVQDVIPIKAIYDDGLFLVGKDIFRPKKEQKTVPMPPKIPPMNMLPISLSVALTPQFTRVFTNSTRQVVKAWKLLRIIFTKQKTA